MARRAARIVLAAVSALALANVMASCARRNGRIVSLGDRKYDVITCPGALEAEVTCDDRASPFGRFDDGIVCGYYDGASRASDEATAFCKLFPHGCTCTKSDAFCPDVARGPHQDMPTRGKRRCAADDPECGPVLWNRACLDTADYHPGARRKKAASQRSMTGVCDYDGECFVGSEGCAIACLSYQQSGDACAGLGNEPAPPPPARFCGCVETQCAWFDQ